MELELKLEWLEGVSKNLGGGQAPQIFLTLPEGIPTSIPIPSKIKKNSGKLAPNLARKNCAKIGVGGNVLLGKSIKTLHYNKNFYCTYNKQLVIKNILYVQSKGFHCTYSKNSLIVRTIKTL